MIRIFEKNTPIKGALERSLPIFLGDDAEVIVANTEELDKVHEEVEDGKPVVFYGFSTEASLRLNGNPAVPYFYYKNTGYCQLPFNLSDVANVYKDICDGKKVENKAAILASQVAVKNTLVGVLLHDLHPGKDSTKPLEKAEKEFGLEGSVEEVRAGLEKIRKEQGDSSPVADIIGDEVLPGIFCDIEGTLISSDGTVNESVLQMLEQEYGKRPVCLWTGGDIEKLQKEMYKLEIKKFPVLSKYIFRNCNVETAIDDLSQERFEADYCIKVREYIEIKVPVL
jgi:hypothetical protein